MIRGVWREVVELAAWVVAIAWCVRTTDAVQNLPSLPDLTSSEWNITPSGAPGLIVVVTARDEAENIAATLDTLLAQEYPFLRIVAVDDRSIDATGAIMDDYAARRPDRLTALHITALEEGWLGKTFAMHVAMQSSDSEYLLFTDADVLFSPSILRRALAYAEQSQAAHLVVMPTVQVRSHGEGIVLGFIQILGFWASRLWRVADADAKNDVIGIGAFNLLRRDALQEIGGLEPQRLTVLEDVTLGRRIKAAGLPQRIAFAPELVLVHWAKGIRGLIRVMTKNLFSAVNFQPVLLLGACLWIIVFCLAPIAGLAWWVTILPSFLVFSCIAAIYRRLGAFSRINARYGWLYPLGAVIFIYGMLWSMVVTWWHRGVIWRGTLYPLRDLRRFNSPFQWRRRSS
jgi:cellulose synthase/poly-beta-1,6-N-acetylglucosamine synthase-like glycosyltransferase